LMRPIRVICVIRGYPIFSSVAQFLI